jgi:hypothetical protein
MPKIGSSYRGGVENCVCSALNEGKKGKDVHLVENLPGKCIENRNNRLIGTHSGTEDYFTVLSRSVRANGIVIKPALTMIPSE